jgi:tetratricopeptide (TPR) repeat protein
MKDQGLAVHRTIVVVDVEGFGDQRRTNPHQVVVREGLYRAMREAFGSAGIPWDDCGHEDRGDGVFILVPAEVPKSLLAESLPSALVSALRAHNGAHLEPERIRLRMALHAGEVRYDKHGVTGAAINLAFRLLDAAELKAALARSSGVVAVIASSWFFEEVVRHSTADAAAYRRVEVAVKETAAIGWICLPDRMDLAGRTMLEHLPAVAAVPGGPPAVALRTLPRDPAAFTGRSRELDRLVAAVGGTAAAGGVVGIHAVDGMAGIGKTAFTVHAAHQLAGRFPDGQIFLRLHAHTAGHQPVDPAEALATLLLTTGVAPQQIPPGLEARSATWRDHLAGKKVLLVLDDAAGSDQVRPLLPGAAGCLVLVTSRRRLTGLEEAAPVSLGTLPPGEAADLFVRLADRDGLQHADAAVAEVTGLCGYLPLAIRLVAAGIRHHPAWTVTDLAADLATARDRLAAMEAEDVSVAAAFDLSYQDLTIGQQHLFRRLGLHPGADIDAYAAAALDDAELQATQRCLAELHDHNLIGEPVRGQYRLHDLLREYARARADAAAEDDAVENQATVDRLLDYYLHTAVTASRYTAWRTSITGFPSLGPAPVWAPDLRTEDEAIAWLGTERANLHACAGYAAAHGRLVHAVWIPVAMSGFLHTQGHWNEAAVLGQAALAAARTTGDLPGQAWALNQLGVVQWLTGDYPAATASLTRALELFGDLGDRRGQACALNQLGVVQRVTGDYPAATGSLTRALELSRDLGDRRGQAWAVHDLGVVQERTGDYPAATASLTQALELSRDLGDQRGRAWVLQHLGVVQRVTGDYPGATASLTRALELSRDLGDRRGQAWAVHDLGVVQERTGDYPAATASLTRALELFVDLGDRRGQAWALHYLGVVQWVTGDYPAASASLTRALELFVDLGDRRGQTWALNHLGIVQQLTGDYPAATNSLTQALELSRSLGDRHGQAAASINLGELLFLSSAYREARGYFAQALSIARDINTPVEEARALEGIGRYHIQEGNSGQGAADLRQALAIYRRIGAPEAQRAERPSSTN